MMFITKNRQKTTLLSPNHEAEVPLKAKADFRTSKLSDDREKLTYI